MWLWRLVGSMVIVGIGLLSAHPICAATVSLTPAVVRYGDQQMLNVKGLTPDATYDLMIYDSLGLPIFPVPATILADADGVYSTTNFAVDQTVLPGILTIEV